MFDEITLSPTQMFDLALMKSGYKSMAHAAEESGVSYQALRNFRERPLRATVRTALICCLVLKCTLDDIYGSNIKEHFEIEGSEDEEN